MPSLGDDGVEDGGGSVDGGELVVAGCEAAPLFEVAEAAFDDIAVAVVGCAGERGSCVPFRTITAQRLHRRRRVHAVTALGWIAAAPAEAGRGGGRVPREELIPRDNFVLHSGNRVQPPLEARAAPCSALARPSPSPFRAGHPGPRPAYGGAAGLRSLP